MEPEMKGANLADFPKTSEGPSNPQLPRREGRASLTSKGNHSSQKLQDSQSFPETPTLTGLQGPSHDQRASCHPLGNGGAQEFYGSQEPLDPQRPGPSRGSRHSPRLSDCQKPCRRQGLGSSDALPRVSGARRASKKNSPNAELNEKPEYMTKVENIRKQRLKGKDIPKYERKCTLCKVLCPCNRQFEMDESEIEGLKYFICRLCPSRCAE